MLDVHGEQVTVTCFDTQVFTRVQGRQQMEQFFKRALMPYLQVEINNHSEKIKVINEHFKQLGSNGSRRKGQKTAAAFKLNPAPSNRKSNFKPSKVLAELQLEVSDMESSEEDDPIVVEESDDLEGDVPEIVREAPENTLGKTNQFVIPDDIFCKENNLTPVTKAVWVDHPLPKGWNSSNNVLTGRKLTS